MYFQHILRIERDETNTLHKGILNQICTFIIILQGEIYSLVTSSTCRFSKILQSFLALISRSEVI